MVNSKYYHDIPHEVKVLDTEEMQELAGCLKVNNEDEFVHLGAKKYLFHKVFLTEAANIYNMSLRADDTFIVTFPKSGTTMTQELVWLLSNNLNYEKAASTNINTRFTCLGYSTLTAKGPLSLINGQSRTLKDSLMITTIEDITRMPSPRFFKSHLPFSLHPPSLLDKTKVIYVIRDPRDVAVSAYYFLKSLDVITPDCDFKKFWQHFISDHNLIIYCPYFAHILEAWERRNHPNILILFYDEMIKDLPSAIQCLAAFLGKNLSADQVEGLANHMNFKNFKENKSVNHVHLQQYGVMSEDIPLIRKGKSGGWREHFDQEMAAQADAWIATNLRDTDFRFPHLIE